MFINVINFSISKISIDQKSLSEKCQMFVYFFLLISINKIIKLKLETVLCCKSIFIKFPS